MGANGASEAGVDLIHLDSLSGLVLEGGSSQRGELRREGSEEGRKEGSRYCVPLLPPRAQHGGLLVPGGIRNL